MITFFACLALLIVGYFVYGTIVNKVFKPDDRATPVTIHPDGVDYCPMKTWRIFLIQLLNIAGLGPIFGALAGACWGPVVYLWIVFGTILGGGVHDYMSGMMSIRHDGASIAEIVGIYLGKAMKFIMRVFSVVLLLLVGTTFSTGPANLLAMLTPEKLDKTFWLVLILIYYLLATFLPIDKIIGKLYPIFGIALIVMAVGIAGGIIVGGYAMPELTMEAFTVVHPGGLPKWAMMFVTVACGAISGFHATQSPMMARCMANEKDGQKIFYGAMVAEGIIALIWAAAGVAFYNGLGGGI
ncbi:MAG: carbon starvation CstA family protein, partial [Pseudoflavonifractor sp.]